MRKRINVNENTITLHRQRHDDFYNMYEYKVILGAVDLFIFNFSPGDTLSKVLVKAAKRARKFENELLIKRGL